MSPREAEEFERRIEAFPEADCDDSYLLDYYVMRVLELPFETLHVLAGGGVKRALDCSVAAKSIMEGLMKVVCTLAGPVAPAADRL